MLKQNLLLINGSKPLTMIYYILLGFLSFIIAQLFFIKKTDTGQGHLAKVGIVLLLTFSISLVLYLALMLLYLLFLSF